MFETLLQMIALIACGVGWRFLRPGKLTPEQVRLALTESVYYLFLPALVLVVLWRTPIGLDSLRISFLAATGILFALLLSGLACRLCRMPAGISGAVMLASAFPNATYLGLPVLQTTFGDWAQNIAIQYDLFACTPLLFTVGILVAQHYGESDNATSARAGFLKRLLRIPPLWAAIMGSALSLFSVPLDSNLEIILKLLGDTVIPLMLVALGLSLQWRSISTQQLPPLMLISGIQLLLTPLLVWQMAKVLGLEDDLLSAVVLEAAMPSMVLGLVLCDRFRLDTTLYALAVTVTTLLSLLSLPLWFDLI
ncbi:MAG TPA: AEC family transporter [Gammaproteobacteria bacterium]|nr:AEC family transporter [Gammaproteobacteria bacterium]